MIKFEPVLKSLKDILQSKNHFSYAILESSRFYSLSEEETNQVKSLVVSILKNYQKLSYEASLLFPLLNTNSDELLLTMITIKCIRDKEDLKLVQSSFISTCLSFRLSPDIQNSYDKIQSRATNDFEIEERVKADPVLYNSIQLELPKFLLEKLVKEYSTDEIIYISKKLQRCDLYYYLPNLHKKERKINLQQTSINGIDTYYSPLAKDAASDLEKNNIYSISNVEIRAYSSIPKLNYMPNILLAGIRKTFSGYFFDMELDELEPKITSVIDNYNILNSTSEILKDYNLKHTTFLPSSFKLLKTYLASNSYNLVIYKGSCLHLGLSSIHPAILPTINENEFINSTTKQSSELDDLAQFVSNNGLLLFVNYAITKDESKDIIDLFLDKHKDFELVMDQKVILNHDESFMGYFALLKRI